MNKVQTTLHISRKVRDRFKGLVGLQHREMSTVIEELMTGWADQHSAEARTERVQMDQAAKIIAEAVCSQLSRNQEWSVEALIRAGMGLPGSTVFDRRIGHFSLEKQETGSLLSEWLLFRSINLLEAGKKVYLICDSGTTVFWFLKAFGEAISNYFAKNERSRMDLSGLTIVTNNIPGAESFVTYASHHSLALSGGKKRICDLVECRLLAGTFLPEYVAVTGKDTECDLESFCARAKEKSGSSAVLIGVTTGNWISIGEFEGAKIPYLLARGKDHGRFKAKLLDVCDEIFVVAPLGKVLMAPVDTLNAMLHYTPAAKDPQERSYEPVDMPPGKSNIIKLVSTFREKRSVLLLHSALVRNELKHYSLLQLADSKGVPQTSLPITALKHLMFPFDRFSEESFETQIEIELPHLRTRTPEIERELFAIRL